MKTYKYGKRDFERLFCILLYFYVPSDQQVDACFAVLASGYFQGRKQKLLEVKGFCKIPRLFEERMLGIPGVKGRERTPSRASGEKGHDSAGQRLSERGF